MTKSKNIAEESYFPLDDNKNYFYSFDIGLVACLLCRGFELSGLDKATKKVLFIVKRKPGIDEEIKNYWDFKSKVDAQGYFNQVKRLKNQIFSSN